MPRIVKDVADYRRLVHRQIETLSQSGIVKRRPGGIREYQLRHALASIYGSPLSALELPQPQDIG
jgi:hypothetical protein